MTKQEFQAELTRLQILESEAQKARCKAKKDTESLVKEYLKEEDIRKKGDILEYASGFILLEEKCYGLHPICKTPIIAYRGKSCNKKGKLIGGGVSFLVYSYDLMS